MSPRETTFSLSKRGKKVVPALMVYQMPPAADATYHTLWFEGSTSMSVTRPLMLAGPMLRQRKAAMVAESSGVFWAARAAGPRSAAATRKGRGVLMS